VAFALAVWAPPAWPQGRDTHTSPGRSLGLLASVVAAQGDEGDVLTRGLVDLGPAEVAPFLRILGTGEGLSRSKRAAVVATLDRLPAELAARHASDEFTGSVERRERLVGLALLAERGRARDLVTAVRLAQPAPADERYHRDLARAVEAAARAVLIRDTRALARVRSVLPEAHPFVRERVVRALGAARADARGLAVLGDLVGRYPSLEVCVLSEIAAITAAVGGPFEWSLLHRVRTDLDSPDAAVRRAAVNCLGRMEDHESVTTLVELLSDESQGVVECAAWALERITRKSFGADGERWRVWMKDEARWWRGDAPELLRQIEHGSATEAVAALARIAGRRLYRDELATAVAASLGRAESSVLRVACSTLQGLGSPRAVEPLIELLDHADPDVRVCAHRALAGITGRVLPPDSSVWRHSTSAPSTPRAIVSRSAAPTADED
jgi:hypothetical protein